MTELVGCGAGAVTLVFMALLVLMFAIVILGRD